MRSETGSAGHHGSGGHGSGGHAPAAVGAPAAARARDVSRPTAEQLAEAERTLVVRHRDPDEVRPPRPQRGRPGQRAEPSSDAS